jgi:GNAT superfamily N-acetyltransferase
VGESPGGAVTVDKVIVPPEMRGKGIGTQFMRDVLDYADANGKVTALTPDASFGGNVRKLQQWYRSLGFEPNKGRSRDFSISQTMVRPPSPPDGVDAQQLIARALLARD